MIRMPFKIGIVKEAPETLIESPCCHSGIQVHQHRTRGLDDTRIGQVEVRRYRCKSCGKTVTSRPSGVSRSRKSQRVKGFSVLLWILGLSYDGVVIALSSLGVPLAKGTAWNYVQQAGQKAKTLRKAREKGKILVIGADGTIFKVKGKRVPTEFFVDALSGEPIEIAFVSEDDAEMMKEVMKNLPEALMMKSDGKGSYATLAEDKGMIHNLCEAHFKKATVLRTKRIQHDIPEDYLGGSQIKKDLARVRSLLKGLTVRLFKFVREMEKRYRQAIPPAKGQKASVMYRMKLLALDIMRLFPAVVAFRSWNRSHPNAKIDGTNNVSERCIGLTGKIRYRTMRGFKSRRSLKKVLNLFAYLRTQQIQNQGEINLQALLA